MSEKVSMNVGVLTFKNKAWISIDEFIICLLKIKDKFSNPNDVTVLVEALEKLKTEAK